MVLSKRVLSPYFLFGLVVVLGWASLRIVGVFLGYILLALFLAYLTYPMYARTLRVLRNRSFAALAVILVLTLCMVIPLVLVTVQLVDEVGTLQSSLASRDPQELLDTVAHKVNDLLGVGGEPLGNGTRELVQRGYRSFQEASAEYVAGLPAALATGLVGTFVLIFVLYYAYTDGPTAIAFMRDIVPLRGAYRDTLMADIGRVVRAVILGTVVTSLIQAIMAGLGFWMFGIGHPIFWGFLVFLFAFLPVVGAPIVWIPWGLYLVAYDRPMAGILFMLYSALFVNGAEHLMRPKIIGRFGNIHPVTVLLGVLGGLVVFGFVGFILGPLILSVFITTLDIYRKEFAARLPETAPTPGTAAAAPPADPPSGA